MVQNPGANRCRNMVMQDMSCDAVDGGLKEILLSPQPVSFPRCTHMCSTRYMKRHLRGAWVSLHSRAGPVLRSSRLNANASKGSQTPPFTRSFRLGIPSLKAKIFSFTQIRPRAD